MINATPPNSKEAVLENPPDTAPFSVYAQRYWPLAAIVVAFLWVFSGTLVDMAERWEADPTFSHGWIVAPASIVFAWLRRDRWTGIKPKPAASGLVFILFGLATMVMGYAVDVRFIPFLSMLITVGGIIVYLYGWPIMRALAFPYAFLFFMVPWPDFLLARLSVPMQQGATAYSFLMAKLISLPVTRDGVNLYLFDHLGPGGVVRGKFEVAVACSGLRSMVALMALSAGFAFFTDVALWKRWLLFLVGIPIALVANVFRVFAILCIGHWVSPTVAAGLFHDWSSPVLFLFSTIGLMAIRNVMLREPKPVPAGVAGVPGAARPVEDDDEF